MNRRTHAPSLANPRRYRGAVDGRTDGDGAPSAPPPPPDSPPPLDAAPAAESASDPEGPRTDTAVNPVIRGESVAIPTPAWGSALAVDEAETVVAELVEEEGSAGTRPPTDAAAPPTESGSIPIPDPAPPRPPRKPVLGILAILFAIATIVVHYHAVHTATLRQSDLATALAWLAIGLSCAGVVAGVLGVVLRSGRVAGILGGFVALVANPWILLHLLTFFST